MKKAYSLDYSIERDIDRVTAVKEILDSLPTDPNPTDLEQMGSYILYGKDENGLNAVQRGETTDGNTRRYGTFKKTDDKLVSLDEVLENPMVDQQKMTPANQRYIYLKKRPGIKRPKYAKDGTLIDIGDGDIPGMADIWDSIDRLEHWVAILEKKIPPDEKTRILEVDSYRLYQLKHQLIDLRRHQYYLRDSYKPTLYFVAADHPKQQFIDWSSDSAYWMPLDQWQRKVDRALLSSISKNLEDYETRETPNGLEVRWVVRRHTFDWENPLHVRALINNFDQLRDYFKEKLTTYGRTLILDFERYRELANFTEVRNFILDKKIQRYPYSEICAALKEKFGLAYNENHVCTIASEEIPKRIAYIAARERLLVETPPEGLKKCHTCGREFPRVPLFFSRNRSRKDGFSSNCKECDKKQRIRRGVQNAYDGRNKEAKMSQMQTGEAGT